MAFKWLQHDLQKQRTPSRSWLIRIDALLMPTETQASERPLLRTCTTQISGTDTVHQVTTDIPPHSHLRGQKCSTLDRTYDAGTRGLGGSSTNPTASCGDHLLLNILSATDIRIQHAILVFQIHLHSSQGKRETLPIALQQAPARCATAFGRFSGWGMFKVD